AATAVTGMPRPVLLDAVDAAGTLALIFGGGYLVTRGLVWMRRRLLWRVRRKLILSYIFVGLVPSLLIVVFFLLAGLLLFRNVASYLVQTRLDAHAEQARFLAQTALLDLQRATTAAAVRDTLDRQQASGEARYPFLSIALVPVRDVTCPPALRAPNAGRTPPIPLPATTGAWAHMAPPASLPAWITCDGIARVVAYDAAADAARAQGDTDLRLVARAVALPATRTPGWAVVLDLPVSAVVERRLQEETGIQLGAISDVRTDEAMPVSARGQALDVRPSLPQGDGLVDQLLRRWTLFVEPLDWTSGKPGNVSVNLSLHLLQIYQRLATKSPLGGFMSNVLLLVLLVVGALFVLIQAVALVLGLTLARQITGAVHDLFTGTEHLRNRDFTHVIPVRARDQFGELADSFNLMTGEVTRLLQDVAQKERLEQEFATAREIQMKLLPQGPLTVPGLGVSAYCEPAREVGGDYYDCFPVDDHVFGFLIADVSGKGVGAGLYMAQLKGLMLSLARQHRSPRDLLIAVNRVLIDHLDGRSFITMSYVVVDLRRQVMTYARAGHCPMIVAPGTRGGVPPPIEVLAPDGLVVGLTLDDGTLFESLLEEVTVPLAPGDLFLLFTDGMSEMMNPAHDCFGEDRLGDIVGALRGLPIDELAGRMVAEVRAFGAGAAQHDDMTMLLLRVEAMPPAEPAGATVAGTTEMDA
ncbi:MAG TPA: SpoIIE family protein phosphatase, partial [Vicinamibacterales bacterium]|nr:SpoIIE family protein phosphatase [Vicinamibacterales bacterium]